MSQVTMFHCTRLRSPWVEGTVWMGLSRKGPVCPCKGWAFRCSGVNESIIFRGPRELYVLVERLKLGTESFMRRSDFRFDSANTAEGPSVRPTTPLSPALTPCPTETDTPLSQVGLQGGFSVLPGITSLANGHGRLLIPHSAFFPMLRHCFQETQVFSE